jgi:hypothetical protein
MNRIIPVISCGLFLFFASCGMEDYFYLNPVDEGAISLGPANASATIVLPNFSTAEYYYFTNFSLFYRIYVSDSNMITTYPYYTNELSLINSSLASDFSALSYYTSNTTTVITNLGSQFSSRRYYTLELSGANIEDKNGVLGISSLGRQITLDFSPGGGAPALVIQASGQSYPLRRTGGDGIFFPVPSDRLFLNTADLNSSGNIVSGSTASLINNDVADKAPMTAGQRHTYVSIYIVTTGMNPEEVTPLYSRPTHVGIFILPDG